MDYASSKELKELKEIKNQKEKAEKDYKKAVENAENTRNSKFEKLNEKQQKIINDIRERFPDLDFDIRDLSSGKLYEKTVVAKGMAAVIGGDYASARDKAILDAQIKALEEIIGVFLDAETIGTSQDDITSRIYSKSKGYVSSCVVVEGSEKTEKFQDSVLLSLECRCNINVNQVFETLEEIQGLYNKVNRPKFVIQAKTISNNGTNTEAGAVENIFADRLIGRGFDVVNRGAVIDDISSRDMYVTGYNENLKAHKVRLVVNVNAVTVSKDEKGAGVRRSDRADKEERLVTDVLDFLSRSTTSVTTVSAVDVQVVDIKTQTPLYSKTVQLTGVKGSVLVSPGSQINKTLEHVIDKFFDEYVEDMEQALFQSWVDSASRNDFFICLKNIDYEDIGTVINQIPDLDRFCKGVGKVRFADRKAIFSVYTKSSIQDLAKILENAELNGKKLKLSAVDENLETIDFDIESADTENYDSP